MNLTFRETGISREVKLRILLLVVVFVASLAIFFFILNFHVSEAEGKMSPPTLPVVTLEAFDRQLAPMFGYVRDMEAAYMHDAIVPIGMDRTLPVRIRTYDNDVEALSIELRSLDTSRKIAVTKVPNLKKEGDEIVATAQLANLIEVGQEYLLVFDLKCGGRDIYYYTRITIPTEEHTDSCVDFSLDFSEKARAGKKSAISRYLETDKDSNKDTLSQVTIKSSADQVCWKGFEGEIVSEPTVEIKDISPTYCVTLLTYYMHGDNIYYYVQEYIRVRYGEERMYLLDYERNMDQLATIANAPFADSRFELGATSTDPSMMSNETGTICAFSNMGSLFEFNENRRVMTRVFSFFNDDINDPRTTNTNHGIRILNIDESGTMDFVVYGYMNSGSHEGECGLDIYHYNSSSNVAKEIAFISTNAPYQILNDDISNLLYRAVSGKIYIVMEGTLYRIDAVANKTSEVMESLADNQYAVSKSGRYIAWTDEDVPSDTIHVMDLSDESQIEIKAEGDDMITPVAFMSEDLVYGCIREKDLTEDAAELKITPMYRLMIVSANDSFNEVIKEYNKKNTFVTEATQDSYALYLTRMKRMAGRYVSTDSDTIMASDGEVNQKVTLLHEKSSRIGESTYLVMTPLSSSKADSYSAAGKNASLVLRTSTDVVEITPKASETKYFVYVASRIVYSGNDLKKAIDVADDKSGVVVDNHQHYVWRDGKTLYKLTAETEPAPAYNMAQKDGLLDLTGCSLSQILYYVYLGEPTYGLLNREMVTLVAYNSNSVTVYSPSTGKRKQISMKSAEKDFKDGGNTFYVMHDLNQ